MNIELEIQKMIDRFSGLRYFHKNLIALSAGSIIQLIIQIISVPLFLSLLDIHKYAQWLFAFNIAQLATLLDLGTISSSQNLLPFLNSKNKHNEIDVRLKQITLQLVTTYSLFLIIIATLNEILNVNINFLLITIFVISYAVYPYLGLFEALTRVKSKVYIGLQTTNIFRIIEFLGTFIGLFLFPNSLIEIALTGLLLKLLAFIILLNLVRPKYAFLRFGKFNSNICKESIKEGSPFLLTKLSDTLIISGLIIALHGKLSSEHFVLFLSARTFFRFGLQITTTAANSYGYEMSECWVRNDYENMKKFIRKNSNAILCLSFLGVFAYLILGADLFAIWTHSRMALSNGILVSGAVYALILSINQGQKTKFSAVNNNTASSLISTFYYVLLVLFVATSGLNFSIIGLFLLLSLCEFLCFATVGLFMRNSTENFFREFI